VRVVQGIKMTIELVCMGLYVNLVNFVQIIIFGGTFKSP
jgi:hypothetical protein